MHEATDRRCGETAAMTLGDAITPVHRVGLAQRSADDPTDRRAAQRGARRWCPWRRGGRADRAVGGAIGSGDDRARTLARGARHPYMDERADVGWRYPP